MAENKITRYFNENVLSGTVPLRSECGIYWTVGDTETTEENQMVFENIVTDNGMTTNDNLDATDHVFSKSEKTKIILSDYENQTSLTGAALVPLYRTAHRVFGNPDVVTTDDEWASYVQSLFSPSAVEMFNFICETPYTNTEAKLLQQYSPSNQYSTFTVQPVYNYYLREYEEYNSGIRNEKNIIDLNTLMVAGLNFTTAEQITSSMGLNKHILASLIGSNVDNIPTLFNCFDTEISFKMPPEYSSEPTFDEDDIQYGDTSLKMREYLGHFIPHNPTSGSDAVRNQFLRQNTYFGARNMDQFILGNDGIGREERAKIFPYYTEIRIDLPQENNTNYREIIENNYCSEILLDSLRMAFVDLAVPALSTTSLMALQEFDGIDGEQQVVVSTQSQLTQVVYKSIDAISLLKTAYNNDLTAKLQFGGINFNLFGSQGYNATALDEPERFSFLHDVTSSARNFHTHITLDTINKFIYDIQSTGISLPYKIENENGLYALYQAAYDSDNDSNTFGNYSETIAYRLTKINNNSNETIQNWWFYNNLDMDSVNELLFQDSQIKYNTEYTYQLYAYKLVGGMKYYTDDVVYTRTIGTTQVLDQQALESGIETDITQYCLEFVSMETAETTSPLYSGEPRYDTDLIRNTEVNALQLTSSTATEAQIYTDEKYLADFNLYQEPGLKIIEVPMGQKVVKILEHPANAADVTPFQVMDSSKRIGFFVDYANFMNVLGGDPFPNITPPNFEEDYRNAYDLLDDSGYLQESPSKPVELQVYRTTVRPTSFEFPKYRTINITTRGFENDIDRIHNYIFYDTIETNQKYYYAFSFLNQHAINGDPRVIIEAELVDDGGYIYSNFNYIFPEELVAPEPKVTSFPFKKLLQFMPSIQQVYLDSTDIDPELTGNDNLGLLKVGHPELEEALWDKNFKIRLISKKTGRMMDINLTFVLEEEQN